MTSFVLGQFLPRVLPVVVFRDVLNVKFVNRLFFIDKWTKHERVIRNREILNSYVPPPSMCVQFTVFPRTYCFHQKLKVLFPSNLV